MTEFEKAIYQYICTIVTACDGEVYGDKELKPIVKEIAKDLLDLARKEILKDLPKWKKTVQDYYHQGNIPCTNPTISGDEEYLMVGTYEIKISDLETLPKEE